MVSGPTIPYEGKKIRNFTNAEAGMSDSKTDESLGSRAYQWLRRHAEHVCD